MTHYLYILLITCCLQIGLQANAQTNLPPWSPPPPQYTLDDLRPYTVTDGVTNYNVTVVPFLLVTGVDTNGKSIYEAPPDWMLKGDPVLYPKHTVRVSVLDELNGETNMTIRVKTSDPSGFFKMKIEAAE